MKKLFACISIYFAMLLTACGSTTVYVPTDLNRLTPNTYTSMDNLTKLAQQEGFNLTFKPAYDISNLTPSMASSFIYSNPGGIYLTEMYYAAQLYQARIIGNFYDQAVTYSPKYLEEWAAKNPSGSFYFMPTGGRFLPYRVCAFIKTERYNAYGKEIKTGSDFEDFLKWDKARDTSSVPCLVGINSALKGPYDINSDYNPEGTLPLDLFMPDAGYTSLSRIFEDTNSFYTDLWMNNDDKSVKPFYLIPEAIKALARFTGWSRDGLIDCTYVSSYSEIIDITAYDAYLANMLPFYNDMTGYTMRVIDQPQLSNIMLRTVAVATSGTDVSEFLRFMEWKASNVDNYMLFSDKVYFQQNNMNGADFDVNIKGIDRFTDIYYSLPTIDPPLDWGTRFSIGNQLISESSHMDIYQSVWDIYQKMCGLIEGLINGNIDGILVNPSNTESIIKDEFDGMAAIGGKEIEAARLLNQAMILK